jgi:hypothetical protein
MKIAHGHATQSSLGIIFEILESFNFCTYPKIPTKDPRKVDNQSTMSFRGGSRGRGTGANAGGRGGFGGGFGGGRGGGTFALQS